MKRTTTTTYNNRSFKRPRSASWVYRAPPSSRPPRRVYQTTSSTLVPLASRGYRPNPVEKKAYDVAPTVLITNVPNFRILCNPQVGSDINQRIGRKITLKSVYIRAFITTLPSLTPNAVETSPSQCLRMILLLDMQPNGAVPAATDLLTTTSTVAQINLANRDRFKILSDKCFTFDPFLLLLNGSGAAMSNQCRCFKKYKKLNCEMIFNGSAGSVADINTCALYMFTIASTSNVDQTIGLNFSSRVRYTDT